MKIEIWSDYVCPFCYIGKRTLEQALEKSGYSSQAEISFKAYELDPNTPQDSTVSVYESLAKKTGQTVEQAKKMTEGAAAHARTVGLEYDFDKMMQVNTFTAHRLVKWAETQGKEAALVELLMKNYFIEGKNVNEQQVLEDAAEMVGLPREQATEVITSARFEQEVRADIEEARQIGVQGVPFFVVNRKYAISGAQPVEAFVEALEQIGEEEGLRPALKPLGQKETQFCTDESCSS